MDNVQIIYRQSCKFPRRCALGDVVDRGAASRSVQAQQIWNYANEEWDLYQTFVQAQMYALCVPTRVTLQRLVLQFSLWSNYSFTQLD